MARAQQRKEPVPPQIVAYVQNSIALFQTLLLCRSLETLVSDFSQQTILCDSKSALQATHNVRNKSGRRIVHAVFQAGIMVQVEGTTLRPLRMSGHYDNPGKVAAD
jgi:hypothetical protein